MDKQIFAALEITGHEVRLIIGEFFNTRFNIIKVERVHCNGLNNYKIESEEEVVASIKKAISNASDKIKAPIKKVLLALPSVNVHRYPLKVTTKVESIDNLVTSYDIQRARKKAASTVLDDNLTLVQTVCVKYTCNGIATRRIPIGEKCDMLTVDIDLLCIDKETAFKLVGSVEKAGLEVLDVSIDSFAIAKEAAMFEQTVGQNIIILNLTRENCVLSLLAKGKLIHCDILNHGINNWIEYIKKQYPLKNENIVKIIKSNARFDVDKHPNYPIYAYNSDGNTVEIIGKQITDLIRDDVNNWVSEIKEKCLPILEADKTTVILTGEGADIQGLDTLLQEQLNTDVRIYIPETLGVRTGDLVACLGLFFAYKDQLPIIGDISNSIDIDVLQGVQKSGDSEEESITKKLKGMLF
ncbi:MAG: cell division protein FtsA [Anaerorhabdus sp.]